MRYSPELFELYSLLPDNDKCCATYISLGIRLVESTNEWSCMQDLSLNESILALKLRRYMMAEHAEYKHEGEPMDVFVSRLRQWCLAQDLKE